MKTKESLQTFTRPKSVKRGNGKRKKNTTLRKKGLINAKKEMRMKRKHLRKQREQKRRKQTSYKREKHTEEMISLYTTTVSDWYWVHGYWYWDNGKKYWNHGYWEFGDEMNNVDPYVTLSGEYSSSNYYSEHHYGNVNYAWNSDDEEYNYVNFDDYVYDPYCPTKRQRSYVIHHTIPIEENYFVSYSKPLRICSCFGVKEEQKILESFRAFTICIGKVYKKNSNVLDRIIQHYVLSFLFGSKNSEHRMKLLKLISIEEKRYRQHFMEKIKEMLHLEPSIKRLSKMFESKPVTNTKLAHRLYRLKKRFSLYEFKYFGDILRKYFPSCPLLSYKGNAWC